MIVGTVKETFPGETRVALTPSVLGSLTKIGAEVLIEAGAGEAAGYPDAVFTEKGAQIVSRADVFARADVLMQIRGLGTNPEAGGNDLAATRKGQVLISTFDPLIAHDAVKTIAGTGATMFALELVPRITRAQSMDILSSMATIAGYKAVLLAADHLPKMFPMMMTAAGTVKPAKVMVLGAGVAGLQAIASSKRLGARVEAYDIRPAVKEQIESLGAKFVELDLDTGDAEDKGGYAKAMDEEFYKKQRAALAKEVEPMDVVISTAAIPGRKAPLLLTADAVKGMAPGSVIVDLAAETGGNCELTRSGETAVEHGVTILGPANLASTVPFHASQMFSKNIVTFLLNMVTKEGKLEIDNEDEVVAGSLVTQNGEVVHPRVREVMGLPDTLPGRTGLSEKTMAVFVGALTVFVLAIFVGFELITKVPPTLHTPLMSASNAISGITLIGALLLAGQVDNPALSRTIAIVGVAFATINVVGGFLVTHRMLSMFKKKK